MFESPPTDVQGKRLCSWSNCSRRVRRLLVLLGLGATLLPDAGLAGATLDRIGARGYLKCGVNDLPGYAIMDTQGHWDGFAVGLCRAIAAAVLRDPAAVEFISAYANRRFDTLAAGDVDVLNANNTWTLSREVEWSLAIATIVFYDGQGFIVHRDLGIDMLAQSAGHTVCVVEETTTHANLLDLTGPSGPLDLTIRRRTTLDGAWYGFVGRQCDLFSMDKTILHLFRSFQTPNPDDYLILEETVSREPLALMVRDDDRDWLRIVRWTAFALMIAEEHGITAEVARTNAPARDAEARRLLGQESGIGAPLGLDDEWARRAVQAAGHYGELFERTLGNGSAYQMNRGLNALWKDGGLIYAPPLR